MTLILQFSYPIKYYQIYYLFWFLVRTYCLTIKNNDALHAYIFLSSQYKTFFLPNVLFFVRSCIPQHCHRCIHFFVSFYTSCIFSVYHIEYKQICKRVHLSYERVCKDLYSVKLINVLYNILKSVMGMFYHDLLIVIHAW